MLARLDGQALDGILAAVHTGEVPFVAAGKSYLGYVMPPDYIMQGMIADSRVDAYAAQTMDTSAVRNDVELYAAWNSLSRISVQ